MQAFHAGARAADPTVRSWPDVVGRDQRVALGGVARMGGGQLGGVGGGFGGVDAASGLELPIR